MNKFFSVSEESIMSLREVAYSLLQQGKTDESLVIFNFVVNIIGDDFISLISLSRIYVEKKDGVAALSYIGRAQSLMQDKKLLLPLAQSAILLASDVLNAFVAQEKWEDAYNIIVSIIGIVPEKVDFLETALHISRKVDGKESEAFSIAENIISLSPNNEKAHEFLAKYYELKGDVPRALTHEATFLMERGKSEVMDIKNINDLIYPQDMYDVYSKIIKNWVTEDSIKIATTLRHRALKFAPTKCGLAPVDTANTYFTVAFSTNDETRIIADTPPYAPWPEVELSDSQGQILSPEVFASRGKLLQAEQVLFVAGDPKYVRAYAPTFIRSVQKHAEIECLIVIMVADGRGQLSQLAQEVGIQDDRLLFMATDVVCNTKRRYTLKARHDNGLVGYYQCARFIWAGYLMSMFHLPLVVADIDVVLQRPLRNLEDKYRDYDVVLNENGMNVKLASIFTANLSIINATEAGERFCRFLRSYMEMMLHYEDLDGFMDQSTIALARAHILFHCQAKVGYLERYDINNTMFNTAAHALDLVSEETEKYTFFAVYGSMGDSALELLEKVSSTAVSQ